MGSNRKDSYTNRKNVLRKTSKTGTVSAGKVKLGTSYDPTFQT